MGNVRARSSAVERCPDKTEVAGPTPAAPTKPMNILVVYFLAGIVQDVISTLNIRFIGTHRVLGAVVSSFAAIIVSMLVLYNILAKLEAKDSIPAIVAYATGIAAGTFLAMKLKLEVKK